ncbi:hypothetical protein BPUTEOMOX_897 [methanotrophic endosymbiont of Bathymodiolus puteoserpentis (Logatchev)]|nr:hypothetical protein BPUTEOMOX_897 [methanotrophic endosymbiont of Bathymodiolus puteoserpentis (Logatchev)]
MAGKVEYEVAGLKVPGILLLGRALFLSAVQFKQALKSCLQGTNLLVGLTSKAGSIVKPALLQ